MTPTIATHGLAVRYGQRTVIDGLNLAIAPGQVYALLGGNGAGKTTTIQTLLGFVPAAAGRVLIGGRDSPPNRRPRAGLPTCRKTSRCTLTCPASRTCATSARWPTST